MVAEYCPDCVEKMVKESRQFGMYKIWLVCPKCGLRARPTNFIEQANNYFRNKAIKEARERKARIRLEEEDFGLIY